MLVSAIKKAEDGDDLILRIYNTSKNPVENASIKFGLNLDKVCECDFNESEAKKIPLIDIRTFKIGRVEPYTAVTFKLSIVKKVL
ncbi:hypothetical protein AGR56_00185 [Clostridium sp. DMHC 10]|uniref:glycosyl hydrolase-related protein n=1 Tax=Clostridium sp. DMHC 10 TaxID=747377 RepID=UPI00069CF41A|nr:glycosyl hydrolase-related protein [Clostridium sp. DMHC 10]KOF58279.1 hypothetical protein AGR56_00185 [Clostridium sp. DMHC 10]